MSNKTLDRVKMGSTNFNAEVWRGAARSVGFHEAQNGTRLGAFQEETHAFLRDMTNLVIYIEKIIVD